jgi:hypothetical protein
LCVVTVEKCFCSIFFFFFTLSVYAWGTGTKGELGIGTLEPQLDPVIIEGLKGKNIVQVSCGEHHSMAISGQIKLHDFVSQKFQVLSFQNLVRFFSLNRWL